MDRALRPVAETIDKAIALALRPEVILLLTGHAARTGLEFRLVRAKAMSGYTDRLFGDRGLESCHSRCG